MLKVGIFTPYVRGETTLAAVQLADWLLRCGIEVTILAEGRIDSGIHPVWDNKVKRATRKTVYAWAYGCTHLCWFSANFAAVRAARLVAPDSPKRRTQNFFFPSWNGWGREQEAMVLLCQQTICLSQDMAYWIDKKYFQTAVIRTWVNLVSPASLLFPRVGRLDVTATRLLAVITKSVELDIGNQLFSVFDTLLDGHSGLHVTFLLEHSLPKDYRKQLANIKQKHEDRVTIVTGPPYYEYVQLARQHDWVYLASTRHTYGSILSTLMSSSVPIICHDVPPVRSYVANNFSGKLINCDLIESPGPVAVVELDDVSHTLDSLLISPDTVMRAIQTNMAISLQNKQRVFEQFIFSEFMK